MKEKFEKILDTIAYGILLILGFAGFLQIFAVFWASLFGVQFHWMQYVSSVVLFGLGILALVIWARISPERE